MNSSKQTSARQIAANRANAQKSTGPKTTEGKAESSRNNYRHGICSTTFVCVNEDIAEYYELRDKYMDRFGPHDQVEIDLIDRMVRATWNLRRCWTMENETIDLQMFRMHGTLDSQYVDLPERTRTAAALEELAKLPSLASLQRYEARQSNEYQRALKTLLELRKSVPLAPDGPLRNTRNAEPHPVKPDISPAAQSKPIPVSDTAVASETTSVSVEEPRLGYSGNAKTSQPAVPCDSALNTLPAVLPTPCTLGRHSYDHSRQDWRIIANRI